MKPRVCTRLVVWATVVAGSVAGCGQPSVDQSRISGQDPSISTASEMDLAVRVAQAYVDRTMFPSSVIADYLLSNRAHRKLVILCLRDAGFGELGYDTSDAMIVPWMNDPVRIPLQWVVPPAGFVAADELPPSLRPAEPDAIGWVPPESSADRLAAFEAAISRCENDSPTPPSSVDWTLADQIDGELIALAEAATTSAGFVPLKRAYEACVVARGGAMASSYESMIVSADPANSLAFDGLDIDAACRTGLYPAFVELKADEWRTWLDRRVDDLQMMTEKWAELDRETAVA